MDASDALKLVQRIYVRLNARRPEIDVREAYVAGKQPLNFATAEWKKENSARYVDFSDNWSAPVVNAEAERIRYTGMKFADDTGSKKSKVLQEQWQRNEMEMKSSQGFVTTLTTSRSFVIVWGDSDDRSVISWEHPSNVEIEYDFANPSVRKAALKTWVDEEFEYATLYTPDQVWKYVRPRAAILQERESQAKQSRTAYAGDGGWVARYVPSDRSWPLYNPLGSVPVVEVPNRPTLLGDPVSELQSVIPMQDAVNLLWAYLFLAADYASMDARVVTGSGPPMIPIIDMKEGSPTFGQKIGEKPVEMKELREKRLLYLTDPDAKIDSWAAAKLDIFTDTIDVAVGHIASQTRTPPTYLVTKSGMSNVNGEGLKASEIGLNKKVQEFQTFASPAIREVNRLVALVIGDTALADEVPLGKVTWMNPEIRSEAQLADMLVKKKSIGYPLEYLMELDGVEPLDIPRILAMKAKEDAALAEAAAKVVAETPVEPSNTSSEVAA